MKLAVWISLGALGLFGSVVGCVTDAESLFGDTTNAGAGGSAGAGEGGSGQGGSANSSSSSGGPGSSSSSSASSSSSSSSSGTSVTVFCQGNECAPAEVCCYRQYAQGQSQDFCSLDSNCGNGFSVLSCNGPSDCPGAICCATRMNNEYTDISCQATCGNPPTQYVVCEGDQSVCTAPLTCQQSGSLGIGYMTCR